MTEFISTLADVSTLWLVLLSFIFCLIPLALVGGLVYGIRKLLIALPPIFERGQDAMTHVADGADKAADRVAAPFITASAAANQVKGMVRNVTSRYRRNV
jgi:hypothetical protein